MSKIQIHKPEKTVKDGRMVFSADIAGARVDFEFPDTVLVRSIGDAYIATCLLEAMATELDIEVCSSIPVSRSLMENLPHLQDIYCCWNKDLTRVVVTAPNVVESVGNEGAASFFSAGVDGSYTLMQKFDDISHLIVLNSFEGWNRPKEWQVFLDKQRIFAASQGKQLLEVSGNFRSYAEERCISHHFQHGLELGGVASALGFARTYIPSSFTADQLFPWGSHPLTDPLWGGHSTHVFHDGYERSRTSKTAALGKSQSLLDNLQVCWAHVDRNCGHCAKCLRTALTLKLLGLRSNGLPELADFSAASNLKLGSPAAIPFAVEIMALAEQRGEAALAKLLGRKIRHFHLKQQCSDIFNLITRNRLKALYHRVSGTGWVHARITMAEASITTVKPAADSDAGVSK